MNRWDYDSIRPGQQGSVGDCLVNVQLRTSTPEMTPRFEDMKDLSLMGSSVGTLPKTKGGFWGMKRDFKTNVGWRIQDFDPHTYKEPLVGSTPQYIHKNRIATVYEAKRTGEKFLPLPGGYKPGVGEMVRGGQMPRITNEIDFNLSNDNWAKNIYKLIEKIAGPSGEKLQQNQWDSAGKPLKPRNFKVKKAKLNK